MKYKTKKRKTKLTKKYSNFTKKNILKTHILFLR